MEIAYCGIICSHCGAYKKGKCLGCASGKQRFASCPVRKCNIEKGQRNCSECKAFADFHDCKKLWNAMAKIFHYIFRSNRIGNLQQMRKLGIDKFIDEQKIKEE